LERTCAGAIGLSGSALFLDNSVSALRAAWYRGLLLKSGEETLQAMVDTIADEYSIYPESELEKEAA
jgi:hypothetical protein